MGFAMSSQRIQFRDAANAIKFDTNWETMFLTDYRTGTYTYPTRNQSQMNTGQTLTSTVTLETGIPSGTTFVTGVCRVDGAFGTMWLPFGGTTVLDMMPMRTISNGSYLFTGDYDASAFSNDIKDMALARAITPYIDGTTLKLDVDQFNAGNLGTFGGSIPAYQALPGGYTIRYYAFCGTFDLGGAASAEEKRLYGDSSGAISVFSDPSNLLPHANPTANISRILFHSNLSNVGILSETSGTVAFGTIDRPTISFTATAKPTVRTVNLFAHGRSSAPMLLGSLEIRGSRIPLNGSFLMSKRDVDGLPVTVCCSVGANATHVVLNYWTVNYSYDAGTFSPAYTANEGNIGYTIYVTNYRITNLDELVEPGYYNGISMTSTRLRAGYFDTNNDYARRGSGSIYIPKGRTIGFGVTRVNRFSAAHAVLGYRYNANGRTYEWNPDPGGGDTGPSNFTASVERAIIT